MTIAINETSEIWLYLHARGEEYFLHYDYWPYVPFTHHFKDTEYWVDINVRKKVLNGVIHKTDTTADSIHNTSDYFGNLHFLQFLSVCYPIMINFLMFRNNK